MGHGPGTTTWVVQERSSPEVMTLLDFVLEAADIGTFRRTALWVERHGGRSAARVSPVVQPAEPVR